MTAGGPFAPPDWLWYSRYNTYGDIGGSTCLPNACACGHATIWVRRSPRRHADEAIHPGTSRVQRPTFLHDTAPSDASGRPTI